MPRSKSNWPPTSPPCRYRVELAGSHNNLGNLLGRTGPAEGGGDGLPRALALGKQLAADFPTVPDTVARWPTATTTWAFCWSQGPAEGGGGSLPKPWRSTSNWPPTSPPSRVPPGPGRKPRQPGDSAQEQGRLNGGRGAYRDALALQEQLATDFPSRARYREDLASSHHNLGTLLKDLGPAEEAEEHTATPWPLRATGRRLPHRYQIPAETGRQPQRPGILLQTTGRSTEAEAAYRDSLSAREATGHRVPHCS